MQGLGDGINRAGGIDSQRLQPFVVGQSGKGRVLGQIDRFALQPVQTGDPDRGLE